MFKLLLLAAVVCLVSCQFDTFEAILNKVILDTDVDNNGVISLDEFQNELLGKWDSDKNSQVTKNEFINVWNGEFHAGAMTPQELQDTEQFFSAMDTFFPFGILTEADLLLLLPTITTAPYDSVTAQELRDYFHSIHPLGNTFGKK